MRERAANSTGRYFETQGLSSLHAHCKKQGRNCSHKLAPCREVQILKDKRDFISGPTPGCSALGRKDEDHRLRREVMGGDLGL